MKAQVYWIKGPWPGHLAILARPRGEDWLSDEIQSWRVSGIDVVVSLLTESENSQLGLTDEARTTQSHGLAFLSFPIVDYSVPDSRNATLQLVNRLEHLLSQGKTVGIHCRQGIGRSALVAACVLVLSGDSAEASLLRVGSARGLQVPDTPEQREWVDNFAQELLSSSMKR
jgi:protein-tyrosine phosphatase